MISGLASLVLVVHGECMPWQRREWLAPWACKMASLPTKDRRFVCAIDTVISLTGLNNFTELGAWRAGLAALPLVGGGGGLSIAAART